VKYVGSVAIGALVAAAWCGVAGATPPSEPVPEPPTTVAAPVDPAVPTDAGVIGPDVPVLEVPPPIVDPNVVSTPLIVVPSGCPVLPTPVAVFVGTVAAADTTTARFAVQQIRAGSLDGYAVDTIVDVRFDDDIRFLHTGQQYLVGAAPDPVTHVLHSKVRLPAPLFGGDAVIGVDDSDVRCPRVEDGVKTLMVDGSEVDTGVLTPLKTAKRSVAKAFLKPLGVAFIVLVVLASMKLLIFAMVRAAREREPEPSQLPVHHDVQRLRQHTGNVLYPIEPIDPAVEPVPLEESVPDLNSR
jgi:hypothetical protein